MKCKIIETPLKPNKAEPVINEWLAAHSQNDKAEIDQDKCVGCGLCAVTCPENALSMVRFEREVIPGTIS